MAKHWVLALVHKENGIYGVSFPDYPGVISGGDTFDAAVNRGANTLSFHLRSLAEDGEDIPLPSSQEEALSAAQDDLQAGALPALIELDFPGKSVRINISIDEALLSQIDREAKSRGQSRSGLIAAAAKAAISVNAR